MGFEDNPIDGQWEKDVMADEIKKLQVERDELRDQRDQATADVVWLSGERDKLKAEVGRLMDGMEMAWGVVANAWGGWTDGTPDDWLEAAVKWRDEHWHPALDRNVKGKGEGGEK